MAVIQDIQLAIREIKATILTSYIQKLDMSLEAIGKGRFELFLLKEIFEQPQFIQNCMRGILDPSRQTIQLKGIQAYMAQLVSASKSTLFSCGTSWFAGIVVKYFIEKVCRIPVEVEYASEFRYCNPIIRSGDFVIVIAISQSRETADTLAAVDLAKEKGATALSICNVVGSSFARATQAGIYTHAGPKIGVASTKPLQYS